MFSSYCTSKVFQEQIFHMNKIFITVSPATKVFNWTDTKQHIFIIILLEQIPEVPQSLEDSNQFSCECEAMGWLVAFGEYGYNNKSLADISKVSHCHIFRAGLQEPIPG